MDTREGLEFLSKHQPMPPDEELDQQLIDYYDEVRKWFILNPDPQCVPLFLNSFGKGDGWGVYQLVGDALIVFDKAIVVPHLVKSLRNPNGSVSYWSAQIACSFPDAVLIAPLRKLIEGGDHDIKYAAITALEQIGGTTVKDILSTQLTVEEDQELKELLENVLSDMDLV